MTSDRITVAGLLFAVSTSHDPDMQAPWIEYPDMHGPVREARHDQTTGFIAKRPGERQLGHRAFCHSAYVYDMQAAVKKARAEGWSLSPERLADWTARAGRAPTAGQIAAAAALDDFRRLDAWARDEWHWQQITVELLTVKGHPTGCTASSGGYESDTDDQTLIEGAHELAEDIAAALTPHLKFYAAPDGDILYQVRT